MLWADVGPLRQLEEAWNGVHKAGIPDDDTRAKAAEQAIELLFDEADVAFCYRAAGAIRIRDPAALAAKLGLDVEQIAGHPLAFTNGNDLIAPWEVTEFVVTTAARQNPDPILEFVLSEEREVAREAIHGRWLHYGRGESHYSEPEHCVEFDRNYYRARRELMRSWCGVGAIGRFDELTELRKEIHRVGLVAESAIKALRAAGLRREAAKLENELGMPVETLRP